MSTPITDEYLECPYCKRPTELIDSKEYYSNGKSYGMMYICRPCDATIGCHGKGTKPLGSPAKPVLRELRKCCHVIFDKQWKYGPLNRESAYFELARTMGISTDSAHIGMFREEHCLEMLAHMVEGES